VNVVLLAAGLGSRLGELTRDLPKALVRVGDRPLLGHGLRFAAKLAPRRIIVVGGFSFDAVAEELKRQSQAPDLAGLDIRLVQNHDFRKGNLLSLCAARLDLEAAAEDGFLLLNVDHIYRPSLTPVVSAPVDTVTAFIDTDRRLGDDDMKVERDARGRIFKIAKTLTTFDCGYVGMTRVPGPALGRYFAEVDRALREEGENINVERILGRLAESPDPPACRDISGHGWLEVDTPAERDQATTALAGPGWL